MRSEQSNKKGKLLFAGVNREEIMRCVVMEEMYQPGSNENDISLSHWLVEIKSSLHYSL